MTITAIINGAQGKMGKVLTSAINEQPDLTLLAALGRHDNLADHIQEKKPDVVIDFTLPDCVFNNTKIIIENNARPIIGTSGLTIDQVKELENHCKIQSLGGVIAPNFSIAAVLMMKYAQDAAKYLSSVEIIEMHHEQKIDAPSGTAKKTAEMIAKENQSLLKTQAINDNPARGNSYHGVPIHSLRLPGLFAHQSVIFGAPGETLTIRHDGMDRHAMMPGVFLACRKAMELNHLVYGLEHLL